MFCMMVKAGIGSGASVGMGRRVDEGGIAIGYDVSSWKLSGDWNAIVRESVCRMGSEIAIFLLALSMQFIYANVAICPNVD